MEQPQLTNQVSEFQPVTSLRPTEYGFASYDVTLKVLFVHQLAKRISLRGRCVKAVTYYNVVSQPTRLLDLILLNLIVRWPMGAAIILRICGMRPSVFERLQL